MEGQQAGAANKLLTVRNSKGTHSGTSSGAQGLCLLIAPQHSILMHAVVYMYKSCRPSSDFKYSISTLVGILTAPITALSFNVGTMMTLRMVLELSPGVVFAPRVCL